jgi:hypothetical protein
MARTADEVDQEEKALRLRLVMADDERTRVEALSAQEETKRLMDSVQVSSPPPPSLAPPLFCEFRPEGPLSGLASEDRVFRSQALPAPPWCLISCLRVRACADAG